MREVLVIAHRFPPLQGDGVQRTLGFVRHLPANGWRPTVICADDDAEASRDPGLIARVPHEVTVVRVPAGWPGAAARWARRSLPHPQQPRFDRWLMFPDRAAPWGLPATQAALRFAREGRFSVVFSTDLPTTNHLVAAAVQARMRIPWVADFQDAGDGVPGPSSGRPREPRPRAAVRRRLERSAYRQADRLVASTPTRLCAMRAAHAPAARKGAFIPDGYAESDFARLPPAPEPSLPLRLGLWHPRSAGLPPATVFEAIARARPHAPPFRLRFIGPEPVSELARRFGVEDVVEQLGDVPFATALDRFAECNATIVAAPSPPSAHRGRDQDEFVPKALYCCLRLGRPIVGVLRPGLAAKLVREAGDQHLIQHPRTLDGEAIARWLTRLARHEVPGVPSDAAVVQRYARDVLTQQLAAVLEGAAHDRATASQ